MVIKKYIIIYKNGSASYTLINFKQDKKKMGPKFYRKWESFNFCFVVVSGIYLFLIVFNCGKLS